MQGISALLPGLGLGYFKGKGLRGVVVSFKGSLKVLGLVLGFGFGVESVRLGV